MATEVTAADRTRWQARAVIALNYAHKAGAEAGLSPLLWQVGAHGLTGTATNSDPAEREAALRAWAALLEMPIREVAFGDHRRLLATVEQWGPARCFTTLTADIYDEGDDR